MTSTVVQFRVDKELRDEAAQIFESLGLDLPTAFRIFLKRSVAEQGIPFEMRKREHSYKAYEAAAAVRRMRAQAAEAGLQGMSLEEINREIALARSGE